MFCPLGRAEEIFADRKGKEMEKNNYCGCVGYGYVPVQELVTVLDANDALENGSLFPELVLTIEEYGKVCKGGCEE